MKCLTCLIKNPVLPEVPGHQILPGGVVAGVFEVLQSSASQCLHGFQYAMLAHLQEHLCFPTKEVVLASLFFHGSLCDREVSSGIT